MLNDLILSNVWVAVGIWAVLYISDHFLTIAGAKKFSNGVKKHFGSTGGYELTPFFEKEIADLQIVSFRFVFMLILSIAFIIIFHEPTNFFSTCWGALVCAELPVHLRHLRNLTMFHYIERSEGVTGCIQYDDWLLRRASATEFLGWAAVFLFIFSLSGSFYFLGGTVSCLLIGIEDWRRGSKQKSTGVVK